MSEMRDLRVPVWCPICSCTMKGKSTASYMSYGCCVTCKIFFIEGREERWKSGWRPSVDDIEVYKKTLSDS